MAKSVVKTTFSSTSIHINISAKTRVNFFGSLRGQNPVFWLTFSALIEQTACKEIIKIANKPQMPFNTPKWRQNWNAQKFLYLKLQSALPPCTYASCIHLFPFLFVSPFPQITAYICFNRPVYRCKDKRNNKENRRQNRVCYNFIYAPYEKT